MKPIIFNTEMVKAILDGRKAVTRRLVKDAPDHTYSVEFSETLEDGFDFMYGISVKGFHASFCKTIKPKYKAGDILYVRETWCDRWLPDGFLEGNERYGYKADGIPTLGYWGNDSQCKNDVWIPSIHMPKEAARIYIRVTDVRVERLQDMPHDAPAKEGIQFQSCPEGFTWKSEASIDCCYINPMGAFKALWNTTVKEDWQKFESNPWVWVIEFERISKEESYESNN